MPSRIPLSGSLPAPVSGVHAGPLESTDPGREVGAVMRRGVGRPGPAGVPAVAVPPCRASGVASGLKQGPPTGVGGLVMQGTIVRVAEAQAALAAGGPASSSLARAATRRSQTARMSIMSPKDLPLVRRVTRSTSETPSSSSTPLDRRRS